MAEEEESVAGAAGEAGAAVRAAVGDGAMSRARGASRAATGTAAGGAKEETMSSPAMDVGEGIRSASARAASAMRAANPLKDGNIPKVVNGRNPGEERAGAEARNSRPLP